MKKAIASLWIPVIAFCIVMAVLLMPKNIAEKDNEGFITEFIPAKEEPKDMLTFDIPSKEAPETIQEPPKITNVKIIVNDSKMIHPNNLMIYEQAVENIRLFESLGPNNYQKIYYDSLNLDATTGTAMEHYYASAIIANYYFVRDNILYVLKDDSAPVKSDLEVLNYMAGKCDEQTYLTVSLMRSVGLDAMPIRIPAKKHMVTAVRFDGITQDKMKGYFITIEGRRFMILDTTCSNCDIGTLPDMDKDQTIELVNA
jgi:hypothetical protein